MKIQDVLETAGAWIKGAVQLALCFGGPYFIIGHVFELQGDARDLAYSIVCGILLAYFAATYKNEQQEAKRTPPTPLTDAEEQLYQEEMAAALLSGSFDWNQQLVALRSKRDQWDTWQKMTPYQQASYLVR